MRVAARLNPPGIKLGTPTLGAFSTYEVENAPRVERSRRISLQAGAAWRMCVPGVRKYVTEPEHPPV